MHTRLVYIHRRMSVPSFGEIGGNFTLYSCACMSCAAQFRARVRGARTDRSCSRGPRAVRVRSRARDLRASMLVLVRDHLRSNQLLEESIRVDFPRDRVATLIVNTIHSPFLSTTPRRIGSRKDDFEGERVIEK